MTTSHARIYKRGADKERKAVKAAKDKGLIAFRSAGSHSPIDVCIIDLGARRIEFLQFKGYKATKSQLDKLEIEMYKLNGMFKVRFRALSHWKDV